MVQHYYRVFNFSYRLRELPLQFNLLTKTFSTQRRSYSNINLKSNHIRYPRLLRGFLKKMKIESEHFKELFTPELKTLIDIFNKYGFEIRISGGPVRDLLSGKKPDDLDFATTALPSDMKEMFTKEGIRMLNANGEKHGTITARINDKENFEITTLRIDVVTDGRHAEVEFTKDWELDAGRRDLTINSMFMDIEGNVYDYFNGIEDLKNKVVKFVGKADYRIQEDFLRILRYFRFYGRISLEADKHDESTIESIRTNVSGLKQISGERIWTEIKKIFKGNYSQELFLKMIEVGINTNIGLPEKVNIEEFKRVSQYIKDYDFKFEPITLITALLKNEQESLDFHTRIKLSAFERDLSYFLVLHRKEDYAENDIKPYKEIVLFGTKGQNMVRLWVEELLKYQGQKKLLDEFLAWEIPKFPINGHMLLERKIPNRSLSNVIYKLKEVWLNEDFKISSEELMAYLPKILKELDIKI